MRYQLTDKNLPLNLASVKAVMDIYEVKDKKMCLNKIVMVYNHYRAGRQTDES